MEDLYLHVFQDIYYEEKQIKKALPNMIEKGQQSRPNGRLQSSFRGD